jgi:hypothetical protein
VFFALAFSAQAVGLTTAYLQDYTKARLAAQHLFHLIDCSPETAEGTAKPVSQSQPLFTVDVLSQNFHSLVPAISIAGTFKVAQTNCGTSSASKIFTDQIYLFLSCTTKFCQKITFPGFPDVFQGVREFYV